MPTAASETPDSSIAYRQCVDDLIAALGTDARQGLTDEDARSRLERCGEDDLPAGRCIECSSLQRVPAGTGQKTWND